MKYYCPGASFDAKLNALSKYTFRALFCVVFTHYNSPDTNLLCVKELLFHTESRFMPGPRGTRKG